MNEYRTDNTLHRVRFAGRSLTVGEDGSIVASKYIGDNGLGCFVVHFFLGCIWFKYFIE